MDDLTYTTFDKETWGEGPWQSEPDKIQWKDEATGFPCLAVRRQRLGYWCGYVGVPPGHRFHGAGYGVPDVDVHGGLTFANSCSHGPEDTSICHIPEPGEPDDVWWLGFDCHHTFDLAPGAGYVDTLPPGCPSAEYREIEYVRGQTTRLAQQLI